MIKFTAPKSRVVRVNNRVNNQLSENEYSVLNASTKEKEMQNQEPITEEVIKELDREIETVFEELDQVNKELFDK